MRKIFVKHRKSREKTKLKFNFISLQVLLFALNT
jgi:hypothetical protein